MQSLSRKMALRATSGVVAGAVAATRAISRTGQVSRTSVPVGGDDVYVDEVLSSAVDATDTVEAHSDELAGAREISDDVVDVLPEMTEDSWEAEDTAQVAADGADWAAGFAGQLGVELEAAKLELAQALGEAQTALADAELARSEAAQAVADAATASAAAAQAVQDALSATALAEGAAPSWATVDPVTEDANGKPAGAIWYVRDAAGHVIRMWELTALGWVNRPFDETAIPLLAIGAGTYGSLAGDRLVAKSVTAAQIQALSITAEELAVQSVIAVKIAANAVTAEKISAGAVTTAKLTALAVTAEKIAAGAIVADKIAAGAITTTKLAATAIDGMTITGSLIRTAATGQRIQLDTQGLRAFNTSGVETATLYSDIGGFVMNGQIAVLKENGRPLVRMVPDPAKFEALGYGGSVRIGTSPANAEIGASGTIVSDAESGLYIAAGKDLVVRAGETARFFGIGSTVVASSTDVRVSAPDIYLDGPVRFRGDVAWTELPFIVSNGTNAVTSKVFGQIKAGNVVLVGELFGSIQQGTYPYVTVTDDRFKPTGWPRVLRGAGFLNGGFSGTSYITADGAIGMSQQSGASRSSMQFSFVFPAS